MGLTGCFSRRASLVGKVKNYVLKFGDQVLVDANPDVTRGLQYNAFTDPQRTFAEPEFAQPDLLNSQKCLHLQIYQADFLF